MTYKEYLTAVLGRFGLVEADIDFLLTEAGLNGDTVVSSDNKVLLKTAIYNHIPLMIAGLSNVSEGGYSVTWNIEGLKLWYSTLADELGLDDKLTAKPVVRDASNRW
jgi:hypothetical protein